jgi:cell division protease FtsH
MRTYRPGPHDQAPAVTWRQWLLPLGAAAGIVAVPALSPSAPSGIPLSYSQFLNDAGAGSVRAVTINPAGQVAGSLVTGRPFTTTIPVALGDRTLTNANGLPLYYYGGLVPAAPSGGGYVAS